MRADRYVGDPVGFIDRFIPRNEKNQPWTLSAYQRRVLALAVCFGVGGRLLLRLLLWSEVKKSGKTFVAACLGLWWAFTRSYTEVVVAANDLEQSVSRVFATMVALCEHNSELRRSLTIRAAEIIISNGTAIKAIPSDYRGEAGARHSLAIFDELWGFDSERAQRLFEELTPPPTEPDAWILVVTTAGFTGESSVLERLYQRGLTGNRLDDELEVYRADDLTMFWSHTARASRGRRRPTTPSKSGSCGRERSAACIGTSGCRRRVSSLRVSCGMRMSTAAIVRPCRRPDCCMSASMPASSMTRRPWSPRRGHLIGSNWWRIASGNRPSPSHWTWRRRLRRTCGSCAAGVKSRRSCATRTSSTGRSRP